MENQIHAKCVFLTYLTNDDILSVGKCLMIDHQIMIIASSGGSSVPFFEHLASKFHFNMKEEIKKYYEDNDTTPPPTPQTFEEFASDLLSKEEEPTTLDQLYSQPLSYVTKLLRFLPGMCSVLYRSNKQYIIKT